MAYFKGTVDSQTNEFRECYDTEGRNGIKANTKLIKDTVGFSGKNKLKTRIGASGSTGDGTWKINADGSVTINATLSSLTIAPWRLATGGMNPNQILTESDIPYGRYKIVWVNANGQRNDNIRLQIYGTNGAINQGTEIANSYTHDTVTIDDTYSYYYARVWINTGTINDTMYGMLIDADILDDTYEPYHENVIDTLREAEVIQGKNLLENKAVSRTLNGVTFTVNENKSVTVNSSAAPSAFTSFYQNDMMAKVEIGKRYIISGTHQDNGELYYIVRKNDYQGDLISNVFKNDYEFVATSEYVNLRVGATTNAGAINNVTLYPMIRLATETDSTYEPYYTPLKESKIGWADASKSVKKNLLKIYAPNRTINDVTFTVNKDGSVTANGTASADTYFRLSSPLLDASYYEEIFMPAGKYLLSGCPSGGSDSTYFINVRSQSIGGEIGRNYGDDTQVTIISDKYIGFAIGIKSGITVNNLVFKPMFRLSSINDNTFVPWIPDNTEVMTWKENGILGARNLITFPYVYSIATVNGVTNTVGDDGIIILNGTATEDTGMAFHFRPLYDVDDNPIILQKGKYRLSKNDNSKISMSIFGTENGERITIAELHKSKYYIEFELTEKTQIGLTYFYSKNEVFNNFALKMLLTIADDTNLDYDPFAQTNKQLTDSKMSWQANAKTGVHNQLPYPYANTTKTNNGITFTDNGDGSITIGDESSSQTATGDGVFSLYYKGNSIPKGTYKLPKELVKTGVRIVIDAYNAGGTWVKNVAIINNDTDTFTVDYNGYATIAIYINVQNTTVIATPVTVYPQLVDINDNYVGHTPYAMTNRELTNVINAFKNVNVYTITPGTNVTLHESSFAKSIGNTLSIYLVFRNTTSGTPLSANSEIATINVDLGGNNYSGINVMAVNSSDESGSPCQIIYTGNSHTLTFKTRKAVDISSGYIGCFFTIVKP